MRYKILMTGKNNTVIDDIYAHLGDDMDLLTTSTRIDDIMNHIKYCQPDLFCYCIYDEPVDIVKRMLALKRRLGDSIPFFVVGSFDNCADFSREAPNTADVLLTTPMKAQDIGSRFTKYLKEHQRRGMSRTQDEEDALTSLLGGGPLEDGFMTETAATAAAAPSETQKKCILVVDDSVTMLKTINRYLHEDYEVATAPNGKVALKYLEKKKADLILLDYEMPDENGPEVLEKLRKNPATMDIPVVFLTGVTERAKIAQALAQKPQGYLLKPVEQKKLFAMIEKTLGI